MTIVIALMLPLGETTPLMGRFANSDFLTIYNMILVIYILT